MQSRRNRDCAGDHAMFRGDKINITENRPPFCTWACETERGGLDRVDGRERCATSPCRPRQGWRTSPDALRWGPGKVTPGSAFATHQRWYRWLRCSDQSASADEAYGPKKHDVSVRFPTRDLPGVYRFAEAVTNPGPAERNSFISFCGKNTFTTLETMNE